MLFTAISSKARLRAAAAPLLIGLLAAPAFAQDANSEAQTAPSNATGAEATGGDIVVTGSRIARPDLTSSSPLAVVGSQQIQAQGITNVQDIAQKLPQLGIPGLSRANSNFLTTGNGIATLNLRNLDDTRTLVLVNGRRFVGGVAGTSIVDVNNIPADFVERIDVVTGGAGAVYGSDAVAGVVNFVLKNEIKGIVARAQYGLTDKGDNRNYTASISGGFNFGADQRGSVLANFTYNNEAGLLSRDRRISREDCSAAGCGPQSYSSYAAQGRFELRNGAVASTNAGGFASNLFTFNPDNSVVSGFPSGYGFNRNSVRRITTPVERLLGAAIARYEVADGITAFLEGTYGRTNSSSAIEALALDSSNDVGAGYAIDNPFIPAAVRAQIIARNSDGIADNNVTSIAFRRRQNEVFSRSNENHRDTFRVAGGFRGNIGDKWDFELSGVYGQLKDRTSTQDIDITKYAAALDAVRDASGNIVCRSATARAAGCVPINLFGYNTASPAASAYVRSAEPRAVNIKATELVINGNVGGSLFALPYGDVQVNVGGEYRREKSREDWDALTNAGLNSGNQTPDTIGSFNVKEVFGEINVPILSDVPGARTLSVKGAARYSDYSTVGSVFTWNAGGEYSPFDGLRFRGNYAVAIRAPNIQELFSTASETFPSVQDPCDGITATTGGGSFAAACRSIPAVANAIRTNGRFAYTLADIQSINGFDGGNRNLQEEKGKTITFGGVLTPRQVPGLSFTADFFDIKVDNAIGIIPRTTSIQQCLGTGLSQFCSNVIRDPNTGFIRTVNATNVNIATLKTRGIDFNLKYGRRLGLLAQDRLDLNILYTRTLRYRTQADPSAPVNSGLGNIEYGGVFRDKINAQAIYAAGPVTLSWTSTYVSRMVDTVASEFTPEDYDPVIAGHNRIKSRLYNDVQIRARVGDSRQLDVYLGADNVFNRKPPKLEDTVFYGSTTGTTTYPDLYDPIGRRLYVGAQVKF